MLNRSSKLLLTFVRKEKVPLIFGVTFAMVVSFPSLFDNKSIPSTVNAYYLDVDSLQATNGIASLSSTSTENCMTKDESTTEPSLTIEKVSNDEVPQVDTATDVSQEVQTLNDAEKEAADDKAEQAKEENAAAQAQLQEEQKQAAIQVEVILCDQTPNNVNDNMAGCRSWVKTYMSYKKITSTGSPQYALLNGADSYTNPDNGIRMVGDRYCIAVGSGYCTKIGTKIDLVMSDGSIVKCIMGDAKADAHTDASTHTYHVGGEENGVYYQGDGSVAEFIVDNSVFDKYKDNGGTVNWVDGLAGSISKVVVLPDDVTLEEDLQ